MVGLRTHVYHGRSRAWTGQELAKYSVVLTTYATMALEAPARAVVKKGVHPSSHERPAGDACRELNQLAERAIRATIM